MVIDDAPHLIRRKPIARPARNCGQKSKWKAAGRQRLRHHGLVKTTSLWM